MMRPAFPLLCLALAGCASDTVNYPSLSRRLSEQIAAPASPAPAPAPTPPDAPTLDRLAALVEQAQAAHRRFDEARGQAERSVAAAGNASPGSEAWAVASVALAALEAARSEAMIALGELDQRYAEALIAGGDSTAVAAARDRVIALVGEEDEVLARLRGRLGN